MNKAIAYRTPACADHLADNDSDECPWCRIKELGQEVKDCEHDIDQLREIDHERLNVEIPALEAKIESDYVAWNKVLKIIQVVMK